MLAACHSSGGLGDGGGSGGGHDSAVGSTDAAVSDGPLSSDGGLADVGMSPDAMGPRGCRATAVLGPVALGKGYGMTFPRLVWDGARYGLIWQESAGTGGGGIRFALVDEDGGFDTLSVQRLTEMALAGLPRMAFSGKEYAATFYAAGTGHIADAQVELVRVDSSGKLIAGSETKLPSRAAQSRSTSAAIAWNPVAAEWGVAWVEGGTMLDPILSFARYSAAGVLVPSSFISLAAADGLVFSPVGSSPLIWTGSGYAVAYADPASKKVDVLELSGTGAVTQRMTLSTAPNYGSDVVLAKVGSGYGIVYTSVPDGKLHFARASGGAFVDMSDQVVGPVGVSYGADPAIATDGTDYVVGWAQWQDDRYRSIWITRISTAGVVRWLAQQLPPGSSDWEPDLVWNGCRFAAPYQTNNLLDQGARVAFFSDTLPVM